MPVIQTQNLKRHYVTVGETVKALDGVDFSVESGEFLAIAGPSGSGKSTLLNLIGALDKPTSGSVQIDGIELASRNGQQLSDIRRERIGFVFQAYNLIPVMSVAENVEYVMMISGVDKDERRERAQEVLSKLGLGDKMDRRPLELSGGQQQRVAVARAIVSKPSLVLADEPTANLDSQTSSELMDLMVELNEENKTTFVFCTHDPSLMKRSRRLVLLRDGVIESDNAQN